MLIDNEKFVGLLVENSGIEKEKVEKYLEELINDIKSSFDEGEGYELEGFGIFSKLGANVLFIPSEELETEINYKYVGMEPIELPSGTSEDVKDENEEEQEVNPIQGILDGEAEVEPEDDDDPFAGLIGDDDPDDEDIETAVEEEIESEEKEDADEELESEPEPEGEGTEALETSLDNIFGTNDEELSEEEKEEEKEAPGPDKWGIDAHKEDDQEDAFSGLMGDSASQDEELIDEDDIFTSDETSEDASDEKEEIDFSALENDSSDEDFDDPFEDLEDKDEPEEEDFIPVVTNVASEKTSKDEEKKDKTLEKEEKKIKPKSSRDRNQRTPVFLYLVLALIILGGSGYLLAYFGVVNIQGITPKSNTQVAQVKPPSNSEEVTPESTVPGQTEQDVVLPPNEENLPDIEDGNAKPADSEIKTEEPEERSGDLAPLIADEKSPDNNGIITPVDIQGGAEAYGLLGTATEAGNNGYTIVLYTLSKRSGADAQFEKLSKDGYRVIIKERPSDTYGVLYRVSIGQFKSLADAAVAAEKVDQGILGNYIITKI